MSTITMQDLIDSLRKAVSNPEAHQPAQLKYFSELQDDSVLTHCGTACCIAGYLFMKSHADKSEKIRKEMIEYVDSRVKPWIWVADQLGLTPVEATLAFHSNIHYQIHLALADILESGLRLDYSGALRICGGSTYTDFRGASIGLDDETVVDLEGFLRWMRSITV